MKNRISRMSLTALLMLALTALITGVVLASTPSTPISDGGITPYIFVGANPGGNVECSELGYDFASSRVNYDQELNTFDGSFPAGISVTVTDDTYVAWTSTFPIGAVIVKGSDAANVYEYDGGSLGDSGLASPMNDSGYYAALSNLTFCWNLKLEVTKTADTTYDRAWNWTIDKVGDQTSLKLKTEQTFLVNYDVTVDATKEDSNWAVTGEITIHNPNPTAIATIESVSDVVSPDITAPVDCGSVIFPYQLDPDGTLVCTYGTDLPDGTNRTNTATVVTSGKVPGGSGTADVTFGTPTNEYDECIDVTDDKYGFLGTVCASQAPKTFEYSLQVGPYEVCGDYQYVNTASFITNDNGNTGSDSWTVDINVPCTGGCTLTPGYWKTHSLYGPAPYDPNWLAIGPLGADTSFFLSGKSYYDVLWTSPNGNAYYILAHAYIAAKLNILNGASSTVEVDAAIAFAENFFNTKNPWSILSKQYRAKVIANAYTLDQYNNGYIGPGHCSE